MKRSSFPPRLSESTEDHALRDLLNGAKRAALEPERLTRALTTFETRFHGGGEECEQDAPIKLNWTFAKTVALLAIVAVGVVNLGWITGRAHETASSPTAAVTTVLPPQAFGPSTSPSSVPLATKSEPGPTRIEDLPSAATPIEKNDRRWRGASSASSPPVDSSFHDELALMEAARSLLATGNTAGCLGALDRYDRRYAGGAFAHEVLVMRVETLVARGERSRAQAVGDVFLAKNPDSPYASRVRSPLAKMR